MKSLFCVISFIALVWSSLSMAEAQSQLSSESEIHLPSEELSKKEMSDESLADLEAKAGITIDMEVQLKIGEFAWLDSNEPRDRKRYIVAPQPTRYIPPVQLND